MLRELELKKPQLDELMVSAESLKCETQREALHGKGEPVTIWITKISSFLNRLGKIIRI